MLDHVVRRLPDPHTDGRGMQPAAMGDQAIADRVMGDQFLALLGRHAPHVVPRAGVGVADLDAAPAQIDEFAVLDAIVPAAKPEGHRIAARVTHGAAIEDDVSGRQGDNGRIQADFRLRETTGRRAQRPNWCARS